MAAEHTVTTDDERIRSTTWRFTAEGDAIGRHTHPYDYIVVPVTGGTFRVVNPDGSEKEMVQAPGEPYLGAAGTDHDVISATDGVVVFVEIELKS